MSRRTALYRLFNADDELLYVGASTNLELRWKDHAKHRLWWPEVARRELKWLPSKEAAERAEKKAIVAEHPKYNTLHTPRHASICGRQLTPEEHSAWVWARSQDGYVGPQHVAEIQAVLQARSANEETITGVRRVVPR